MSLKDLSPSEYARLSQLLDQALELDCAARDAWLADLAIGDARGAALLAGLLASQRQSESDGFLENRTLLLRELASESEPDPDLTLIGKSFGPYRVLSLIGRGGMGSVWLAERSDGLFTRRIALKLLHPALMDRAMTERFAREREILASLNHPNIARLLDAGFAADGQPYLALEYVEGRPLIAYCDACRLSLRARLELFLQVLDAVQYAHGHLVLHRDLKPSNILVSEDGEAHLLDFGIAKLLTEGEARQTELTRLAGGALTLDYAAPEQIAGAPLTTAADVYSLGVTLYGLLTGASPYRLKRDTHGALEEAILETAALPPSRLVPSNAAAEARGTTARKLARALKGDLDTIVNKALQKSASKRYATAMAFAEDIQRHLRGEVVLAQADSLSYRALKFVHRHRFGIAVAGIVLLTLAAGLAATSYEAEVAAAQRDLAVQAQLRSLTQTAAARLSEADVPAALAIILEVLRAQHSERPYAPEALDVFQKARSADAQLLAFVGHTMELRAVAFSPDGRRVATGSDDGTARIFDAALGEPLLRLSGHAAAVRGVAFSPDGARLISASYDGTARLWDTATGREVRRLAGHSAGLTAAAFSPDGTRLLTTSLDRTARIWDAATGRELLRLSGHTDGVASGAFSPDGRYIVTASFDRTARLWDASTGRELRRLEGHTDRVTSAGFSPDGGRVVTGSFDHTARLWDAATGRELTVLRGHTALLSSVEFSPDGTRILTTALDKSPIRLWDAASGAELARFTGNTDFVRAAAFSPDGTRILTACADRTARLWDVESSHDIARLEGHTAQVSSATFSPDGGRILTSSYDGTARLWDASSSRPLLVMRGHSDWVSFADFSPDGTRIVTASTDNTARLWDASSGQPTLLLQGHGARVETAGFSPDGWRVVTASADRTARVWDALTGRELMRLSGHTALVESAAFSPDGRRIATASHDRTARIWDSASGRSIAVLRGHADRVETAEFSPDGTRVVTASDDGTARIWDGASAREILRLREQAGPVNSAVFSPDGRRILTASGDGTARLWDAATGEQLGIVARHGDLVETAAFARDGRRIVTASDDRTARVWDASTPALEMQIAATAAAQFNALSSSARFELGLPEPAERHRGSRASRCDEAAGAPYDPDRRAPGVMPDTLAVDVALVACEEVPRRAADRPRWLYERGRARLAGGDHAAARSDLEAALAQHYRSAAIDLAMLLAQASLAASDVSRAVALYEQAWKDHVTIAGFKLGELYEHGVRIAGQATTVVAADSMRAGSWYERAAAAGEPHALARLAERAWEIAYSASDAAQRSSKLLEAFGYYARAAARAQQEDWPDEEWRSWRYRRASAARLLTRAGMMPQVAQLYDRARGAEPSSPTPWQRLQSLLMPHAR